VRFELIQKPCPCLLVHNKGDSAKFPFPELPDRPR
jgi:hypothetical protein